MTVLVFLLILFLLLLLLNLLYQNKQLRLQRAFSRKCPHCRKNQMWKKQFMYKLAVNNFFSKLNKVERVSYIKLDKSQEAEIQSYFDRRNFIIQRLKAILKTFYKNLNYLCKMINPQLKTPTLLILLMLVMGKI